MAEARYLLRARSDLVAVLTDWHCSQGLKWILFRHPSAQCKDFVIGPLGACCHFGDMDQREAWG